MTALPAGAGAALAAAAEWRLLALLLSRPREGWREEVEALAREVGPHEDLRAAAAAARDASEGAYHALLGAGAVASPREAAHAGFLDPGRILADLAACYAAFGFTHGGEEPDDHLAVECDFVAYLHLKEAYALAGGRQEAAELTRDVRGRFLSEHVALAGRRLAARLPEGAPAHLAAAASWLAARLPPAPPGEPRSPIDPPDDGCPMSCGPCPG